MGVTAGRSCRRSGAFSADTKNSPWWWWPATCCRCFCWCWCAAAAAAAVEHVEARTGPWLSPARPRPPSTKLAPSRNRKKLGHSPSTLSPSPWTKGGAARVFACRGCWRKQSHGAREGSGDGGRGEREPRHLTLGHATRGDREIGGANPCATRDCLRPLPPTPHAAPPARRNCTSSFLTTDAVTAAAAAAGLLLV